MTGPIDEAYVEIKPDLDHFDRDMQRGLDKSFDRLEDKLDDVVDVIERQFAELIKTLHIHFEALENKADRAFEQVEDAARDAGRAIATDIEVGTKVAKHEIDDLADNAHHDFNRIERDARGSGFSIMGIFSGIGRGISKIFSNVAETVSDMGSKIGSSLGNTIGQVGSSISTVGGGIGGVLQVGVMAIAIPLILGLAGALSQLVGILAALPAAAGVATTAILPLVLAFHGFSDAIGAIIEGDPEKINEALKKLSPSAASVAREFQKLVKPFGEIQKLAQESLFKPLVGELTNLANAVLPALRQGVPVVAAAFGNMFKFISQAFSNGEFQGVLVNTFATTARIIETLTPQLGRFAELFISIWQIGLPYIEQFVGWLNKGFTAFNDWLEKSIDGGQVTGWLDKAVHVGGQLWEIFKQLSIYIGTLLGSFADEGTDTLDGIIGALQKANEYLASDKGAETLHNLGVIVHWAGNAFVFLLDSVSTAWDAMNGLFNFVRGIGPFFASLGNWFVGLWNSIVNGVTTAWNWIKSTITSAWNGIVSFFTSTGTNVSNFFVNTWNSIVAGVRSFIANTIVAIQAFPGALKQWIVDSINSTAYSVGYIIGTLIRFFTQDLPNGVMAGLSWLGSAIMAAINGIVAFFTVVIPNLAVNVGQWFQDMWNTAYHWVVVNTGKILYEVGTWPAKVLSYIGSLAVSLGHWFENMWHTAVNFFRNLGNDIVSEARSIPGRVASAISSMMDRAYQIGRDIVSGIVSGLRAAGGWLVDEAKNLASRAFEGAKSALGINSPSKLFMELGMGSAEGFIKGMNEYPIGDDAGDAIKTPVTNLSSSAYRNGQSASPQVNVGGASIIAYLQIGDDQLHPVMVRTMRENPQDVALAAQQGDIELSRRR